MIIVTTNDLPGHATERLIEEAEAKGANAILAFRFDSSELGTTWTEICAYGTAILARPSVGLVHRARSDLRGRSDPDRELRG
jgi:antibiotic biosynthesis monooxygenase (ABM) superfamily enzyme